MLLQKRPAIEFVAGAGIGQKQWEVVDRGARRLNAVSRISFVDPFFFGAEGLGHADHEIGPVFMSVGMKPGQCMAVQAIIRIQKQYKLPDCPGQTGVSGLALAAMGLEQGGDIGVLGGIGLHDVSAVVSAFVVHQDDFQFQGRHCQDRINAFGQPFGCVVDGNDDGDVHCSVAFYHGEQWGMEEGCGLEKVQTVEPPAPVGRTGR
nr:hypothetical protein [Desulfonatronum sp. SC1]